MPISSSSHSRNYLTYMESRSQKNIMEEPDLRFLSQKLLTCYKPCRSKTLSERGCTGFHISKINNRSWIHNGFLDHDKFLGGRHTKNMERTRKFQILRFLCHFWPCRQGFRVGRGLERILSHMAPSCFDTNPYRARWTRFKSNSVIFGQKSLDQDLGPSPGLCEVRRLEWRIHSGRKDEKICFGAAGK